MDDLISFLNAQIDEDERVATATLGVNMRARMLAGTPAAPWHWRDNSRIIESSTGMSGDNQVPRAETWVREGEHIIRHDPARVLAEVATKRQIIALCQLDFNDVGKPICLGGYGEAYWDVVRLLALPYADHPDYQDRWAL